MEPNKEKLIYIFDAKGSKEVRFTNKIYVYINQSDKGFIVSLDTSNLSNSVGHFELIDQKMVYVNTSSDVSTWVDGNYFPKDNSLHIENNMHILLTKGEIIDDKEMASLFFVGEEEGSTYTSEILLEDEVSKRLDEQLPFGSSLLNGQAIYIRHKNRFIHIKKQSSGSKVTHSDNILSIRIKERLGRDKRRTRKLLKNINIDIKSKEMVLVIGGSGAGKTTFMNAVSGYEKADAAINYGNYNLYDGSEATRRLISVVPQFDTLRDNDRVYNTLKDAALIQLPMELTSDKKKLAQKVDEILEIFGLEKERRNFVSKLSGGQRRRLSIAVEYLAEPEIFFLDEPDSGLDVASAESVMNQIRKIVDEGKISIIISHSPDRSAHLFDKLVVIAKDSKENCGQLAFYGPIDSALDFFQVAELEDIVKVIDEPSKADFFIDKFKKLEGNR